MPFAFPVNESQNLQNTFLSISLVKEMKQKSSKYHLPLRVKEEKIHDREHEHSIHVKTTI